MADARYKLIVDRRQAAGAATFERLAASSDWKLDKRATADAPGMLSVLTLKRPLAPDALSDGMAASRAALGVDDLSAAGVTGELAEIRPDSGPRAMMLIAPSGAHFDGLAGIGFGGGPEAGEGGEEPEPTPPAEPTAPAEEPASDEAPPKKTGKSKVAAPAPAPKQAATGAEATIAAVDAVLGDPADLWEHLGQAGRAELAAEQIPKLYDARTQFARRSEWALAPELALLELAEDRERPKLASDVLKIRAQLTAEDTRLRGIRADLEAKHVEAEGQRVALQAQRVEIEKRRVELADEGVKTAREMRLHMQKWRKLAGYAPVFLAATTAIGLLAIGYMLMYLLPGDHITSTAVPIAIFALAVFAISPAVLLLLERPLKGVDDWVPGGSAKEEAGTKEKPGEKEKEKAADGKTGATAPADAPKSPS
jgi:hypothetical protein